MGFHIFAAGSCGVDLAGIGSRLEPGDIAAVPFGTPHVLGGGAGVRLIDPGGDLPAHPWATIPILRSPDAGPQVRILCGYVQCDAMPFAPLRNALPTFLHVRTATAGQTDWPAATIAQIVTEVDQPQPGGPSVLERLTEVAFLELLRRQFQTPASGPTGWLAAIAGPAVGRCLALIRADPRRDWTLDTLATASRPSRSALSRRFETLLTTAPIR